MKIWSSHLLDNLSNCLMDLKNSGDSTGFEPMTSATPVQCSKHCTSYNISFIEILCLSYDTPLHLLGFVSTADDVVMDEKRERRKINCGTEKEKYKSKNHKTVRYDNVQNKSFNNKFRYWKGLVYGFQQ